MAETHEADLLGRELDALLGAKIRRRRKALHMSQAALGLAVGVSFQQVQKYEQGRNRIAASTLLRMACALSLPVSTLVGGEGAAREGWPAWDEQDFEFLQAVSRVRSPQVRAIVLALVEVLADA